MGIEGFPMKAEREQSQELQDFLSSVDFSTIKNLFQAEAEKAEVKNSINIIDPATIDEKTHHNGEYNPGKRSASINLTNIKAFAEAVGVEWQIIATQVLIHEQAHAATDQNIQGENRLLENHHIGYERVSEIRKTPFGSRLGYLWNEGVTEMWTRSLLRKYFAKTHGKNEKEIGEYFQKISEVRDSILESLYEDEVNMVETFIKHMAKDVGVNEEIVRTAVIHGMLRGESLSDLESEELADNVFPKNFIDDLDHAERHNTIRRLTRELNTTKSSWTQSRFVRRLLRGTESYLEAMNKIV